MLVERYAGLVWSVARAHDLAASDAADVVQTTWLRLVENLHRLRHPERISGWLAATARHESLRLARRCSRERPDEFAGERDQSSPTPSAESAALEDAGRGTLLEALGELPERCRALLRMLAATPAPSYADVATTLDVPVGSIGPTRGRCLNRLRRGLAARGVPAAHHDG